MKFKKLQLVLLSLLISFPINSDEIKLESNTELNFFTGMFDFSDDGKRSSLFGVQHQNKNLNI